MGCDDPALSQRIMQQLEVRFLEQGFGWAFGVRGIGDNDVELVATVPQEFEAVADVGCDTGMLEADGHGGQVLFGETDDGLLELVRLEELVEGAANLVDIAEHCLFDALVLHNFSQHSAVSAANDKDLLWAGMRVHG